jgi:hypothetical protein
MTQLSPADLLALIESKARGLRAAGVTRVQLSPDGHVSFELVAGLLPEEASGPRGTRELHEPEPTSAFDDPETFGLPPGTPVPSIRRHRPKPEDSDE